MKNRFDFSCSHLLQKRNGAVCRPFFCAAAFLLLTVFSVSCVKGPSPEEVTAAYFEAMASGDTFAVRPYLTPEGQDILDQMAAMPEVRKATESRREAQKQFWNGVVRQVSPSSVEGNRAVVVFTAEVPGRGRASCPIVLFLIEGDWRISSMSVTGLQADRFLSELVALKSAQAPAAASAAAPAAPASAPAVSAPVPESGAEKK